MKKYPKLLFLLILLAISLTFLMTPASAYITQNYSEGNYIFQSSSSNGDYTVKVTRNNNVVFFDNRKGTVPWTYDTGIEIGAVAISNDGNYVAVGCEGGQVFFFNTSSGGKEWERTFGNSIFKSISITKANNYIILTTIFNQVFYVTRDGVLESSSVRGGEVIRPPTLTPRIAPSNTIAQTRTLQIQTDSPNNSGNNIFFWVLIVVIVLVVFWAIIKSYTKIPIPTPQKGTIYAKSVPEGAEIYLNGVFQGISPVNIRNLPPGLYTMRATFKGYTTDTQQLTITTGQTVWLYTPTLHKLAPPPPAPPKSHSPTPKPFYSLQELITQLGAKTQNDREVAQKELIIKVNTEGKTAIQKIIKELETQPSGIKREIVNLLYFLSRESHDGGKVIEELITALTYSSPDVKWLIIQTLGRIKDKRAIHALQAATSDPDFLVRYWAIISMKNVKES